MINLNSNKKEILDKGLKVFSIRVLGYGFGFLFTWILANKYGAKVQGVFSIAFLFMSIGGMVAKFGVESSIVKWIASFALFFLGRLRLGGTECSRDLRIAPGR